MTLRNTLERQGHWLFRRRSYLPLLLIPLLGVAISSSDSPSASPSEEFFEQLWRFISLSIAFGGLGIRLYVIGHVPQNTSGRNRTNQRAEVLNTTGLYSVVRHPLYLANATIIIGLTLSVHVWWFTVITAAAFWLYYERIMFTEEEFLYSRFGDSFLEWAARTPAFFPRFSLWEAPSLPFSLRTVLKREYSGFLGIIVTFTGIELLRELLLEKVFELDSGWIAFSLAGIVLSLALRTLRKTTRILSVERR